MSKKVLLLCASHNDLGLIRALRKMGYHIIVTGNRKGLIGEKFCDEYICADYSDEELILKIAEENKVDAICPCCNDFGVYTASYVAEKLGLPGHDPYKTVLTLHNKDLFKKFAIKNSIQTPRADSFCDKEEAIKYIKEINYPIIIKPIDASAGNGINRADNVQEAADAIEEAFMVSRKKRIVIEPFIEGSQHGFCSYLLNKKVVAYCSDNEYSFNNKYRVEIASCPSENNDTVCDYLVSQIERIAKLLNLKDGIFHLQYIFSNGQPQIIEVMRRILGNMYSIPSSMLIGFDWDYWEARARCGLDCSGFPLKTKQEGFFAYKTIMGKRNGTIAKINIPEKYNKYIFDECILREPGYIIEKYQSDPIGFLFMMFSSAEEMRHVLVDKYDDSLVELE